ncbi:MAG: CDP-alcohol phosphatidyltransferase family protein, partial [Gammaproteobacteria bacterium]
PERARLVAQFRDGITSEGYQLLQNNDMVKPFDEGLRKYEPVDVHKITADKKLQLEDFLFGSAYKGVTDFVTRFIWPKPAAIVTRLCAAWGVTPNQVTLLGLLLMLAAGVLFWHGWFLCGLLLAWVMTFLDTVDGKLARVTVSSSVTGHALDHGMDILHPPGWYFAWGIGLFNQGLLADTFVPLMFCMFIAYTGGRMIEGAFELYTPISIFIWRRFDSLNRLITARRNPNMVLLTCCTILGQPLQGLYAVVIWHSVSTLILLWRLGLALYDTGKGQPIESWLAHLQPTTAKTDWATRLFLQRPSPPPHQDSC